MASEYSGTTYFRWNVEIQIGLCENLQMLLKNGLYLGLPRGNELLKTKRITVISLTVRAVDTKMSFVGFKDRHKIKIYMLFGIGFQKHFPPKVGIFI